MLFDNWIRIDPPAAMLLDQEPDWRKVRATLRRAFGDDLKVKVYAHGRRAAEREPEP